jgi:putative ABC transport system ATP-binding protein
MYDASKPGAPLALDGVWLTLPSTAGPVEILRGIDFGVEPGERVAVVGPSGSGKSTLLAIAAGLERPTQGKVRLLGKELSRLGEDGRARLRRGRVSLVFQAFHLLPNMTAEENVAAPLEIAGAPKAGATAREWLDRVGLSDRLTHYPHQLSGGEQQRVAIARAIVNRPAILLADEPTGNLDSENSRAVLALLRGLNERLGQTILMITHNPDAAAYGHRTVHMRDGKVE